MKFFGRETAVSADNVDTTREFWELVRSLQREKADLYRERDMWRDKYLLVTGQGNYTYPQEVPLTDDDKAKIEDIGPLGKHVSIMGLRAKHEIAMREQAKKDALEYKSPSIEGKRERL